MTDLAINISDITSAIRRNLEGFDPAIESGTVGRILEVGDGIARVSGLPGCSVNEILEFQSGDVGLALNLDEESIGGVVLGSVEQIEEGQAVRATGRILSVPVGDAVLGRVVNALGQPIDGQGEIAGAVERRMGDPGTRRDGPQARTRAAADGHQGHRLDDPGRPRPARAHHRRPQDRQDLRGRRHDSESGQAWV